MCRITNGRIAASVLAFLSAFGTVRASAAETAQLIVYGTERDSAACSVTAEGPGSFSLPHKLQCGGIGPLAPFTDMGAVLRIVHAYRGAAPQFGIPSTSRAGEMLLNFDASERTSSPGLGISIPELAPGEFVALVLQWELESSSSRIDLCVAGLAGSGTLCTGANKPGGAASRVILIGNSTHAASNSRAQTVTVQVALASGAAPAQLRLAAEDGGARATIAGPVDRDEVRPHLDQDQPQVDVNLDLNPTTINVGQSATLTWTTMNADACTASGAWSGSQPFSGTQVVMPSSANSYSYTLTCTNSDSQSMETQVLTVLTPSSGGGGALDLVELTLLVGLGGAQLLRRRMRSTTSAVRG